MHVKVVAGWYDGAPIEEPFEYDTAGQPCALVPGQTLVSFPEGLVEHFPEDRGAVEMGLESYLAVCLRGSQATPTSATSPCSTRTGWRPSPRTSRC